MTTETLHQPTTLAARPRRRAPGSSACAVATAARAEPIGLSYVCPACFGPLEVAYDYAVDRAGR